MSFGGWHAGNPDAEVAFSRPLKAGFTNLGYIEGKTIVFEERYPDEIKEQVLLLVNGFGATPRIQLYLMVNSAKRILDGAGITATRFLTGSYVTALDMAGASDAPVHTAALRWGA